MTMLTAFLTATLLATGCTEKPDRTPTPAARSAGPVCSAYGGFEGRVCPVSLYALIADPAAYHGRTVAFKGYVDKAADGTILVYPSREAAESGDLASSVLCASTAKAVCGRYVGKHAEVFGVLSDRRLSDVFFEPVGTLELADVRSVATPAKR